MRKGRTTVYNNITSPEKMAKVNPKNLELEEDFIEYMISIDRAKSSIKQYTAALHVLWCWNLEHNDNISFLDFTKRQVTKFQNYAINTWGWSPARVRLVKSVARSLENFISNILDEEYPNYRKIWDKIESPVNEQVREKSVFTMEEMQDLLDHLVENKQYEKACFLSLAINSGRRKSELARFKVSYFNKENLICDGALYKTPEKMTTKGRGSKGKLLYVYTLAKPFQPYLDLWLSERESLGISTDWLFPKFNGNKWLDEPTPVSTFDSYAKSFTNYLDKPWYVHNARHFFTTNLSENNIPDSVIKNIVGWSTVALVDVYRDTDAEDDFEKYFGSEGIKKVDRKSIGDL